MFGRGESLSGGGSSVVIAGSAWGAVLASLDSSIGDGVKDGAVRVEDAAAVGVGSGGDGGGVDMTGRLSGRRMESG